MTVAALLVGTQLAAPLVAVAPARAEPSAREQAEVLAAHVAALAQEYRRRSDAARAAASRLATAYAGVSAADDAAQAAADDAADRRAALAQRARDVYALGDAAGGQLALLTADSPDDALWRLSVGATVSRRLLARATEADAQALDRAAEAGLASDDAAASVDRVAHLLAVLREQQDAAAWTLDRARGELARLRTLARGEELARLAEERLAAARAEAGAAGLGSTGPVGALGIPAAFELQYRAAAPTCPGLDWTLLAAVGQVESGHGRTNGPSSAGAIGPMQFMPATFAAYATDGDGDGVTDPWNPADAIRTAARYLCASGAGRGPAGVRTALFAYNHAQWYVDLVLAAQRAVVARYGAAADGLARGA